MGIVVCMMSDPDHTSQGARFVTGVACVCCEITHHSGYDLLAASACVCCEITHHGGGGGLRFVTGIGLSVVRSHITGGSICYGHRRGYVVSTCQGVRFVTSIGVCLLALPSPGLKMFSNSNFQCIQSSNSSNLQAFKLPNSQTLKMSSIRTPRLFNPPKFETFRTFKV